MLYKLLVFLLLLFSEFYTRLGPDTLFAHESLVGLNWLYSVVVYDGVLTFLVFLELEIDKLVFDIF